MLFDIVINRFKGGITMNKPTAFSFCSLIFLFALLLTPLKVVADSKTMPGSACAPANPNTASSHPNFYLLEKLNIQNLDASTNIIAENFIWHYFNPRLPELHGDYHGIEGFKEFFAKLYEISNGSFHSKVIDRRVVGDELVVIQVCNQLVLEAFEGDTIEIDVIVVWRIVDGKIVEGWDIPSIYNVRIVEKS